MFHCPVGHLSDLVSTSARLQASGHSVHGKTVLLHVPGVMGYSSRAYMGGQQEGGGVELSGLGLAVPVQSDLSTSLTLSSQGTTPGPPCVHMCREQMNDKREGLLVKPPHSSVTSEGPCPEHPCASL